MIDRRTLSESLAARPAAHVGGLLVAMAVVAVLGLLGGLLLGAPGLVFGLFLGGVAVLGLLSVAYASGSTGLVDLARRTAARD